MSNRLSYSAVSTYESCGKKYFFSYVEKLRPTVQSSALLFGSAFDKAIEAVLKDPSCNEKDVFDNVWQNQTINKRSVDLVESTLVSYSASDFDEDLLQEDDISFIKVKAKEYGVDIGESWQEAFKTLWKLKKDKSWSEHQQRWCNVCNWLSMRRKGHLMLEANREQVLPRFNHIINTQTEIQLNNDISGDTLVGFPDLVAIWEDNKTMVFDYKTASVKYPEDAVKTSPQLTIYCHALGLQTAGYIVFNKHIGRERVCEKCKTLVRSTHKSCPSVVDSTRCNGTLSHSKFLVDIQILIDDISPQTEEQVLASIESANQGIHNKVFEKNYKECYGRYGICQYLQYCKKGNKEDLE